MQSSEPITQTDQIRNDTLRALKSRLEIVTVDYKKLQPALDSLEKEEAKLRAMISAIEST